MSILLAWVVAASTLLAPNRQHDQLAAAIATRAEAEAPLFKGDDDRRRTSAFLVAIAFRESSLQANAVGDHVAGKPTSFCAFQIHLPFGAKTAEGWTGSDLAEDAEKCVTIAMRMLRQSMQMCPAHPLAFYASGPSGCENVRAQRISRDRLAIAQRLLRDVRVPATTTEADSPEEVAPAPPPSSVAVRPAAARPRRFCGGA
ncbi:MAG TPA: hypothetical protein VLT33_12030 [Labilithrix sp.]|nr:hypothetical protein [Labilithrix sp.]